MAAADGGWRSVRSIRGKFEITPPPVSAHSAADQDKFYNLELSDPKVEFKSKHERDVTRPQEISSLKSGSITENVPDLISAPTTTPKHISNGYEDDLNDIADSSTAVPVMDFLKRKEVFQKAVNEKINDTANTLLRSKTSLNEVSSRSTRNSVSPNSFSSSESPRSPSTPTKLSGVIDFHYESSSLGSASNHSSPRTYKERFPRTKMFASNEESSTNPELLKNNSCKLSSVPRESGLSSSHNNSHNFRQKSGSPIRVLSKKECMNVESENRGRTKEPNRQSGRSRSLGEELKARREMEMKNKKNVLGNQQVHERRASSDAIDDHKCSSLQTSEFKDKQKMIEAVIKKGPKPVTEMETKNQSMLGKNPVNVFRKISFTSKQDKDLRNKIAKNESSTKVPPDNLNLKFRNDSPEDSDKSPSGKHKFSKMIPKLSPLSPSLKLPPNLLTRKADPSASESFKTSFKSSYNRHNTDHSMPGMTQPKRKTLPEEDLIKIRNKIVTRKSLDNAEPLPISSNKNGVSNINTNESTVKPLKPSQIYTLRHAENSDSIFTSPSKEEVPRFAKKSSNAESNEVPVRPPRRRNSGSPRKKNKAPMPPSTTSAININVQDSLPNDMTSNSVDKDMKNNSHDSDSPEGESKDSLDGVTINQEEPELPVGPPPKKPPRTFAYEIYNNYKIRRLSKSSSGSLSRTSTGSKDIEEIEKVVDPANLSNSLQESPPSDPVYAVPSKKNKRKESLPISEREKPAIAPKPAHVKNLVSKRLSVGDSPVGIDKDSCSNRIDRNSESDLESTAHHEKSEKQKHSVTGDPPLTSSSSRRQSFYENCDDPPSSLQTWSQIPTLSLLRDGKLDRQKSMSDETLVSSLVSERLKNV